MIIIDFDRTYDPLRIEIDRAFSVIEFWAEQVKLPPVMMRVTIKAHSDPLLPNVYNLAMGPPVGTENIDDKADLKHSDSVRVFSTAILFALTFLTEYPELTIGLDGSDDLRATLYHSMFKANREHLSEYFVCIGVDWYVKLLRNKKDIERQPDGTPFFKPRPEAFDYSRNRHDLYRYYMLDLKQ